MIQIRHVAHSFQILLAWATGQPIAQPANSIPCQSYQYRPTMHQDCPTSHQSTTLSALMP